MTVRSSTWLFSMVTLAACAGGADAEHPLDVQSAFDSAGGRTFFVAHEVRDADGIDYDIVLGWTDGFVLEVEHRITPDSINVPSARDVWAASSEEAWAISDERLFRRDASGWSEVPVVVGGVELRLTHILGTAEGIAISATYGATEEERTSVLLTVDATGVIDDEPLPEEAVFDDLALDESGRLLLVGPTLFVRQNGEWTRAGDDGSGFFWLASDAGAYAVDFGTRIAHWSGGELQIETVPVDAAIEPEAQHTETVDAVRAIGGELWVLVGQSEYECSSGFFFPGTCGYSLRSYRAMVRREDGAWVDAIGEIDAKSSYGDIVEIDGDAWIVAPDPDAGTTRFARLRRPTE
jgi:hypothetical protein